MAILSIPAELGQLTALRSLKLTRLAHLSSTIPTELGSLTDLIILDLSITELSGTLPTELGRLTKLEAMELILTDITGTVPDQICDLKEPGGPGQLTRLTADCKNGKPTESGAGVTCDCSCICYWK